MSARLALGVALLLLAGCSSTPGTSPGFVTGEGIVHHESLEGGFWSIEVKNRRYTPVDLAAEARVDGQKVSIVAITDRTVVSYLPGPFIRIVSLELVR